MRSYLSSALSLSLLLGISALALTACGSPVGKINKAQYWQRVSTSDATYMRGPKAQDMLNRDIARCVVELRELERIGMLRDTIPMDNSGRLLDPPAAALAGYDTPERQGALLSEHGDYFDFEGCMMAKGWERTAHLPFDIAIEARDQYLDSVERYQHNSRYGRDPMRTQESGEYKELNN